ncbi:MAG: response regulator [Bacteroidales bacterium]|nr:response regulator [Bacteroidales bacterium]
MSYLPSPLYKWNDRVILIADDDLHSYHLLYEMLKNTSCSIIHSLDGIAAFVNCIRSPKIDLVLMDIKLPKLDGFETTRLIKKHRPDIPVFAQTAHAMVKDKEMCIKFGCDEYFAKPINITKMMSTIDQYFGRSQGIRMTSRFLLI